MKLFKYLALILVCLAAAGCGGGDMASSQNEELIDPSASLPVAIGVEASRERPSAFTVQVRTDGFDYPIGDRGYDASGIKRPIDERITKYSTTYDVDRNREFSDGTNASGNNERGGAQASGAWANVSDVGNYVRTAGSTVLGGLHPGEDWNYGFAGDDDGQRVYAAANGVVIAVNATSSSGSPISAGWTIVVKHQLPDQIGGAVYYSIYTHVTGSGNTTGRITPVDQRATELPAIGSAVTKGQLIARLAAGMSLFSPHLHFEIRDSKYTEGELYPNDNGTGYYSDTRGVKRTTTMTLSQVQAAFALMKSDGILDPSDFIDDNRTHSVSGNSNEIAQLLSSTGFELGWGYFRNPGATSTNFQWYIANTDGYVYALGLNAQSVLSWLPLADGKANFASLDFTSRITSVDCNIAASTPSTTYRAISMAPAVNGIRDTQTLFGAEARFAAQRANCASVLIEWYYFENPQSGQWYIVSTNPSGVEVLALGLTPTRNNYAWRDMGMSRYKKTIYTEYSTAKRRWIWKVRFF